jgi:cell division protein FtsB
MDSALHTIGYGALTLTVAVLLYFIHTLTVRLDILTSVYVKLLKEKSQNDSKAGKRLNDLDDCRKDNIEMTHRIAELNKELKAAKEEIRRHERERYKN